MKFDFLGYTFRPRLARTRWGKFFVSFTPAISNKAATAIRQKIRSWKWQLRPGDTLEDLAIEYNPMIRGWINYYGRFNPSAMLGILDHINWRLIRWATCKYKKLRGRQRKATRWLRQIAERQPNMFVHWGVLHKKKTAERQESYESRDSRTVLREPEGEAPLGYSPGGSAGQPVLLPG